MTRARTRATADDPLDGLRNRLTAADRGYELRDGHEDHCRLLTPCTTPPAPGTAGTAGTPSSPGPARPPPRRPDRPPLRRPAHHDAAPHAPTLAKTPDA